jgi:hypothetical protein
MRTAGENLYFDPAVAEPRNASRMKFLGGLVRQLISYNKYFQR